MRILLQHVTNTLNYGSMMMAENLITYLNRIYSEEIRYEIDSNKQEDLERLKKATNYDKIDFQQVKLYEKNTNRIKKVLTYKKQKEKIGSSYDYIIFLGGDDFSEIYAPSFKSKIYLLWNLLGMKYLNVRKNVILLGQTIGPYTGIRKKLASKVFQDIKVITRDDCNLEEMQKQYTIKAISSRDLAFLELNLQQDYESKYQEILKEYALNENKYIVIVGTGLYALYCKEEQVFLEGFINMIKTIKQKMPDKEIVWLSHVTTDRPANSDNVLLEKLQKKFPDELKDLICISEKMLPVKARIILGHAYTTITCRMHAAVSSFQMGRPAICLSYSPKYKGVIAEGLNQKELVIEAKGELFWKNEVSKKIEEKLDYIIRNYKELVKKATFEVKKCQEKVYATLENLLDSKGKSNDR